VTRGITDNDMDSLVIVKLVEGERERGDTEKSIRIKKNMHNTFLRNKKSYPYIK
jgi:hypothetical protein